MFYAFPGSLLMTYWNAYGESQWLVTNKAEGLLADVPVHDDNVRLAIDLIQHGTY